MQQDFHDYCKFELGASNMIFSSYWRVASQLARDTEPRALYFFFFFFFFLGVPWFFKSSVLGTEIALRIIVGLGN